MASRDVNTVVAQNLAFHMKERKETQSSLARKSGVGQTTIGVYLDPDRRKLSATGKMPSAKISELALLADALEIHVWELLIDAPEQSRRNIRDMITVMTRPVSEAAAGDASKKSRPQKGSDAQKAA